MFSRDFKTLVFKQLLKDYMRLCDKKLRERRPAASVSISHFWVSKNFGGKCMWNNKPPPFPFSQTHNFGCAKQFLKCCSTFIEFMIRTPTIWRRRQTIRQKQSQLNAFFFNHSASAAITVYSKQNTMTERLEKNVRKVVLITGRPKSSITVNCHN
jgi:hypothetical protein